MYQLVISRSKALVYKLWLFLDGLDKFFSKNSKAKFVLLVFATLFFAAIIFVFNQKTPLQWDDFKLNFIWPEQIWIESDGSLNNPTERIGAFADIFQSQYNHYYTWGGRTVVHIIAQSLLYINPIKADILNTLMYLGYVFLIYFHIIGRKKNDALIFIGVNILVWLLQPVFGETILWLTGSANYLWGTSFVLAFLLPFRLFQNKAGKYTLLKSVFMFILGIIAGWTNENTVAATIFLTVLLLIYFHYQKWRIPAWAICGFVGLLVGYVIMIAAPGNFSRAELRTSGISPDLFHLSYRFLTSTQHWAEYLGVINLIGFILLLLFRRYSNTDKEYKRHLFLSFAYLISAFVAVYVMLFSPFFPPRAWFGAITFNIIAFGVLYSELNLSFTFIRQLRVASFLFGVLFFGFTLYEGYRDMNEIDNLWKERRALIIQQKETGEPIVLHYTWSRTKFALSDPPFLKNATDLYYGTDVIVK